MVLQPTNRIELWGFVRSHFGLSLPYRAFTPGHSTALDFLWDALAHPGSDIAAWACRSGAKTLSASILAALEHGFIDSLQCRVLSGSEDQAKNLYGYWQKWCNGFLSDRLDGKVSRLLTNVGSGKLEILSASHRRVRGPKVHRLYEDELDEIDSDIDSAAAGMIASSDSIRARTICTSTWHRVDGPMSALIESCPGNGVRLHRWNIWEAVEKCSVERHENGRGCQSCELSTPCLSKAQQVAKDHDVVVGIASEATGLYRIDDLIKAYLKVSSATWESEYLCSRPSVEGLVFPEFRIDIHRCDDLPKSLKIYRAVDWGGRVFVCLWIGEDKDGNAYVLDSYRAQEGTVHQHVKYIRSHHLKNIAETFCDPAGRNRNDSYLCTGPCVWPGETLLFPLQRE